MGEELGWDAKRKEQEFGDAMEFLKSMGLPQVSQIPSFQAFAHENQDQKLKLMRHSYQHTKLKLSDVKKSHGHIGPLGLAQKEEVALYQRAQFTPDEVSHLRTQFERFDFVSLVYIHIARHVAERSLIGPRSTYHSC